MGESIGDKVDLFEHRVIQQVHVTQYETKIAGKWSDANRKTEEARTGILEYFSELESTNARLVEDIRITQRFICDHHCVTVYPQNLRNHVPICDRLRTALQPHTGD
jgi:hypothetical protein